MTPALRACLGLALRHDWPEAIKHGDTLSDPQVSPLPRRRALAEGDHDLLAFYDATGRLPALGDEVPPWRYRGWFLPYAIDVYPELEAPTGARWAYWLETILAGRLPERSIPQVDFSGGYRSGFRVGSKALASAIDDMRRESSSGVWTLLQWLAFGLGVEAEAPTISEESAEMLYRADFNFLLQHPGDYWGWLLSEYSARADRQAQGFFPTPQDVVDVLTLVTMPQGEDCRALSTNDPAVGTGRMLLAASNYTMSLYGQDVSRSCVWATLINGALYAPWLAFPLPPSMLGRRPEESEVSAAKSTIDAASVAVPAIGQLALW